MRLVTNAEGKKGGEVEVRGVNLVFEVNGNLVRQCYLGTTKTTKTTKSTKST